VQQGRQQRVPASDFIGAGDTDGLHGGGGGHSGQEVAAEVEKRKVTEAFVAFRRGVRLHRRCGGVHAQAREGACETDKAIEEMSVGAARRDCELADRCTQIAAGILEMGLQPAIGPLAEEFEQDADILDCADTLALDVDPWCGFGWHSAPPLRRHLFNQI